MLPRFFYPSVLERKRNGSGSATVHLNNVKQMDWTEISLISYYCMSFFHSLTRSAFERNPE